MTGDQSRGIFVRSLYGDRPLFWALHRHQTVSAYLKVRTFCFVDVDKSAQCVIQEIEEVFENRAHDYCHWLSHFHLSTLHTPYFYRRFLNLSQATGRYFLCMSLVKTTWIWQVDRLYFEPCARTWQDHTRSCQDHTRTCYDLDKIWLNIGKIVQDPAKIMQLITILYIVYGFKKPY